MADPVQYALVHLHITLPQRSSLCKRLYSLNVAVVSLLHPRRPCQIIVPRAVPIFGHHTSQPDYGLDLNPSCRELRGDKAVEQMDAVRLSAVRARV